MPLRAAALVACVVVHTLPALAADSVAMITDLEGDAVLVAGGQERGASILEPLGVGEELRLQGGGRLVLVYLGSGMEYGFAGPAAARVGAEAPRTLSGRAPRVRDLSIEVDTGIRTTGKDRYAQAAIRLRGLGPKKIKLTSPPRDSVVLETAPAFEWRPHSTGLEYRFVLTDAGGGTVLETRVDGTRLELPAGLRLERGVGYAWRVEAALGSGGPPPGRAHFRVIDEAGREEVERHRPGTTASVSERVVFAAWLEARGLLAEATRYWRELAAERPRDPGLEAKAR